MEKFARSTGDPKSTRDRDTVDGFEILHQLMDALSIFIMLTWFIHVYPMVYSNLGIQSNRSLVIDGDLPFPIHLGIAITFPSFPSKKYHWGLPVDTFGQLSTWDLQVGIAARPA